MSFEKVIRTISATIAMVAVYLLSAGFYLSYKGFSMGADGVPVLIKKVHANMPEINANIVLPEGHVLGKKNAPISIYEFSSFGCSHCAEFHLDTLPKIKKEYVDNGLIKVIFVPFPLDAKSMKATMVSECIDDAKYFDFIDVMFKKQREWWLSRNSERVITQYAKLNGLSEEKAVACMKNDDVAREIIAKRQMSMDNFKIQGTPSFLIAYKNERNMRYGAPSFEDIKQFVDAHLNNKNEKTAKK